MARIEIATLLTQSKLMQSQLVTLTEQLTELAKEMTDYRALWKVTEDFTHLMQKECEFGCEPHDERPLLSRKGCLSNMKA